MKSVCHQIGLMILIAVLTSLRISLNFEGVIGEIGKYPFVKILIDVAYVHIQVINSLYKAMYLSGIVLR